MRFLCHFGRMPRGRDTVPMLVLLKNDEARNEVVKSRNDDRNTTIVVFLHTIRLED